MRENIDITDIQKRFVPPKDMKWDGFFNRQGGYIRYAHAKPTGKSKGTMVLLQGFRQSMQEYIEVMNDMLDRGFEVWTMDWRGQGASGRYVHGHPQRVHCNSYEEHIDTLDQFLNEVVKRNKKTPLILSGHSMGAHIALRYLKERENDVTSAILTAPMIDMKTWGFPKPVARLVGQFMKAARNNKQYVLSGGDWKPMKFKDNKLTSCPDRFRIKVNIYQKNPELRMGAPTYGWLNETFKSVDVMRNPHYLHAIQTPVLMQVSGKEEVVELDEQFKAVGLMRNVSLFEVPEARHEIWLERDELRGEWLNRLDQYLDHVLEGIPLPPLTRIKREGIDPR